jgi:hypothetical protein
LTAPEPKPERSPRESKGSSQDARHGPGRAGDPASAGGKEGSAGGKEGWRRSRERV